MKTKIAKYILPCMAIALTTAMSSCGGVTQEERSAKIAGLIDVSLIPCRAASHIFYVNSDGETVLDFPYDKSEGKWYAPDGTDLGRCYSVPELYPFCEGVAFVKSDKAAVFINTAGDVVLDCADIAENPRLCGEGFVDGLAYIYSRADQQTYVIDHDFNVKYVIDDIVINPFNDGLCVTLKRNSFFPSVVNEKNEKVIDADDTSKTITGMPYAYAAQFGVVDYEGEIPEFLYVEDLKNGKKWLEKGGDFNREWIHRTSYAFDYNDLCVACSDDDKWGLVDRDGKWVFEAEYDGLTPDGDWYAFKLDGEQGWLDKTGKVMIQPEKEYSLHDGFTLFGIDKWCKVKNYFIDRAGQVVLELEDNMRPICNFIGDRCVVRIGVPRSSKYTACWIDREGGEISDHFPINEIAQKYLEEITSSSSTLNRFYYFNLSYVM